MTSNDASVVDEYKSSLAELTVNSKPHINMLTMLADDYIEHAPAIVRAIESHLHQVPGEIKLPVLYLIDSIVKNVGKKYVQLFTQNIVSTFVGVFEKVDEKGRSQMYKLRQTWGGIFPTNKLFKLDTRVNSIDPAWPITASPSPSIHVNPKFLQTQTQQPPPAVLCKREEILKQQKELLELQKRKVELELMQTKAFLAEQQQKTVEKQPLSNIARDPRLRRQENSQNNEKSPEKPKLKRIPKLKVPPTQEAIQQEVAQYRVLPKSREESPNVLVFKNLKTKKSKDETPSQEKLLEKRSKREELLKDLQQEQKEAEKIVVDIGKSSKSLKENDQDEAVPSKPKKPKKQPKQRKRKRSPGLEPKPEVKPNSPKPKPTDEAISGPPSSDNQPKDTDLRLLTAPVPPPPPPPNIPSPEPPIIIKSPPSPEVVSSPAKKSKTDLLEPLDGLFGSEDVDLRTFPPPPPVISRPSPPPPLRTPPPFHHVANEKSWANFKGPPRDVPEESTPKFRKNPKFESRFSSPIEILDDEENGDDRASENCNLIIRQAEEQLSSGDITFAQYNRLLKEVITMNEERKLQEALKKEKQHATPPPQPQQPPPQGRYNKGGIWFRPGRNPHRQRQQSSRWLSNGLPPADPVVLDYILKDPTRTITVDGTPREVRHYGETAVIFMGWEDPRELSFQPGQRRLYIDDRESYTLQLNAPYREIIVDNVPSKIRLGTPTRELYVDGVFYEVSFGGPPVKVRLGNELKSVRLTGPVPPIRISPNQRKDLVAGKVNMIVDAKDIYPIYLDSKPQRFDISGVPYILRFVEALQTVLINGVPFKIEFGSDLPIPMYFHGEKHYLRFSVLPRGIRPGYVSIVNMEGGRLRSPTPPPPLLAPPPPPVITQPSQPVEVLASLISSQTSAHGSQNYMVDQPIEQPPATKLDVTELVQKLVAIGVVPPSSTNDSSSSTPTPSHNSNSNNNNKKEAPTESMEIHPVDFSKTETMRTRQPGLVYRLYSGIQCSICGVRFPPEHTVKYSQHLDWHFRQNRRERDAMRVAQSRRWYYDVSDWIQFQEIEDQDERTASWFELQKQEQGKAGGADGLDGGGGGAGGNAILLEEPSVSSAGVELPASCALCHDPFDQFYHEEKEEWQLKPAIRVGDLLYHPLCFKEFEERGDEGEVGGGLEDLDESLAGPEDDKLETIEIDSEPPGSANSSAPSPVPGDLDDVEMSEVHVVEDSVSKEATELEESEKQEEEPSEAADEGEKESLETESNDKRSEEKKKYDDLDDDILHIEVLEQKIETYELSDEEGDSSLNRKEAAPESEEEVDYSKVTVKAEKIDVCDLVTSQSQPTVVSTIDGNVDLEEATPMSLPKRIKINITSAIGKSTTTQAGLLNDVDDFADNRIPSAAPPLDNSVVDSTPILPAQPPPPGTSPDRLLRPLDSRDDSEPPPPGEEMTPLPVSLKPKLRTVELTPYPPVKRGSELSALCSIM